MSKILKVKARQVFDSRGNPTVEAEVFTKNLSASAICPSGASTGTYEAFEKRDINNKRYLGKSVLSAIHLVNTKISKKLKGQSIHNQERVDALMINLDGTKQKIKLGANSILAVSIAVKKLSARIKKVPLYKTFLVKNDFKLPYPLMNIINGGVHANNSLRIQEFMIRPDRAKSFSDAMRICFLVVKNLSKLIKNKGMSTSVGDEGGFAPMISSNNQALDLVVSAIKKSGFKNGKDVSICLDIAANELFKNKKYAINSTKFISPDKTLDYYLDLIKKYPIKSIEDPFFDSDSDGVISFKSEYIFSNALFAARRDSGAMDESINFTKSIFDAFIEGRTLIHNQESIDKILAQGQIIANNWEKVIAATIIHNINKLDNEMRIV